MTTQEHVSSMQGHVIVCVCVGGGVTHLPGGGRGGGGVKAVYQNIELVSFYSPLVSL